jgi:tRNA pseudouridine55 synthase
MAEGFLLIDKAGGWTSHDVVAKCRGILGERRVGHAGTLDPMATGLLVLGVGRATRLIRYVQEGVKTYVARVAFGIATDTLDADGAILSREPMSFDRDELDAVATRFVGSISQIPPMVSAVRVGGRRLYELAREGIEVERAPRPVEIHSIEVLEFAPGPYPEIEISVTCGSGTYIRTLADDLARALGGRAHLTALRRTTIGNRTVDAATTVEDLDSLEDPATQLLPMAVGLDELGEVVIDEETVPGVSNGVVFPAGALGVIEPGSYRVTDEGGRLLAVYVSDGRRAKPEVVLA